MTYLPGQKEHCRLLKAVDRREQRKRRNLAKKEKGREWRRKEG
jgi:hypothetical protein